MDTGWMGRQDAIEWRLAVNRNAGRSDDFVLPGLTFLRNHQKVPLMPDLRKTPPREVALLIEWSSAYARGLLQGIVQYMRENEPWILCMAEPGGRDLPAWLRAWTGDGIIARIETAATARAIDAARLPTIDVSSARLLPELPCVHADCLDAARQAAEHLRERGFRHFAFCGDARFNWSQRREKEFSRYVRSFGYDCQTHTAEVSPDGSAVQLAEIARWIATLPKPVGIMASNDTRGRHVLEACRLTRISVPSEVAVVGVDNDELHCELSTPSLTSIALHPERVGYEAAALLDRRMRGERVGSSVHRIPAKGLVVRQSTEVLAIDDQTVVRAAQFIQENACLGIGVQDVLKAVPLSRRALDERFKRSLGRTPHQQIQRVRLDRVRQLLSDTDLPLSAIAERTGFEHVEYLTVVFKRETNVPPSRYRAQAKATAARRLGLGEPR